MTQYAAVPKAVLLRAAKALEEVAHDRAGHSQSPGLIRKEDTREWNDAQVIRRELRRHNDLTAMPIPLNAKPSKGAKNG